MARLYCSVSDVKQYLPDNIIVEGTNPTPSPRNPSPDSLKNTDMKFFIEQACDHIDASLGTMYDVPLQKVNVGGEVKYPGNIPAIAALFTADLIYRRRLKGADRQMSETIKDEIEWAKQEMQSLQNGERQLFGQRNTVGSRFVRGTLHNITRNPAEGGRSQGGK